MARDKRKRWGKNWHHRVPDFKLVYCGPKKTASKKETVNPPQRTMEVEVTTSGNGASASKLEKEKKSTKSIQTH